MDPGTIVAVVTTSAAILSILSEYYSGVKGAKEDIQRLSDEVEEYRNVLQEIQKQAENSNVTRLPLSDSSVTAIGKSLSNLKEIEEKLTPNKGGRLMKRVGLRALKWPLTRKEVDKYITKLERRKSTLSLMLGTDQTALILRLKQSQDLAEQDRQLGKLPYADGAAFDSRQREREPQCIPDTRVDLLRQLQEWSADQGKPIFWLNGMAGTGKSTIARTVAQELSNQKRLGASFFFSRGAGDLGYAAKFVSTVAYQMSHIPSIRQHVCEAIAQDNNLFKQGLRLQWKRLILEPFAKSDIHEQLSLSLVVDALDECENEEDIKLILQLFVEAKNLTGTKLKILVTSRPETPIRTGFHDMSDIVYQNLVLHEIPRSIIEKDISVYLRHEFSRIRRKRNLSSNWPDEKDIELLIQKSDCLFIYVATACRFIEDEDWLPDERLSLILQGNITSGSQLDQMYTEILKHVVFQDRPREEKSELSLRFKQTVGSIIVLLDVLSITALANLLSIPVEQVKVTLRSLHSVLNISKDQDSPIRLLHPSFRDFLLDTQRCQDTYINIDEEQTNKDLFNHCLQAMSKTLMRDICGLKMPGARAKDLDSDKIDFHLPIDVQYACCYWVDHLERMNPDRRIESGLHDGGKVHHFLKTHVLHWLEALSLMGKVPEGKDMIFKLESILEASILRDLVSDAKRFILINRSAIEEAPLQIYFSALVFVPRQSVIRNELSSQFPTWIKRLPVTEDSWNLPFRPLKGRSKMVNSVTFSLDGQNFASASLGGIIRLWNPKTGMILQTLEGHAERVTSLVFSPDGQQLASASLRGIVRLWDSKSGTILQTLEGHFRKVSSVAFSFDGQQLASASSDKTVRLWDSKTGANLQTLEGHSAFVSSVAFSPNGQQLASASWDKTVQLWDPKTGVVLQTLKGHSERVTAVIFSPDGRHLASTSFDTTIRLWDPETGTMLQTLEGHSAYITSAAFSPNGQQIASGSWDNTVRLWDLKTGKSLRTLSTEQCVNKLAFAAAEGGSSSCMLETNLGQIQLNNSVPVPDNDHIIQEDPTPSSSFNGWFKRSDWLTLNNQKILLFPPRLRSSSCSAWHGNCFAIGQASGRVSFLEFDEDSDSLPL